MDTRPVPKSQARLPGSDSKGPDRRTTAQRGHLVAKQDEGHFGKSNTGLRKWPAASRLLFLLNLPHPERYLGKNEEKK